MHSLVKNTGWSGYELEAILYPCMDVDHIILPILYIATKVLIGRLPDTRGV